MSADPAPGDDPAPTIADTPAALTPEWLTAALRRSSDLGPASVTGVAPAPLGTGQMCDTYRLAVDYDRPTDVPAHLIAKLPAADPDSRAAAMALRCYEKEVRFYQQLAPELPVRTPRVHHADLDEATGSFVLLLDDLAPATAGDQLAGCTVEEAARATRELVGLHAPRWGDPGLADLEWLAGRSDDGRQTFTALLPALWQGFLDRYGTDVLPHVREAGNAFISAIDGYSAGHGGPVTVVHGDYRLDNLLFDPPGPDAGVAVVDWQTCGVGSGPADVAYFVGAGLAAEDRRAVEEDLVREYHRGLQAAGVAYAWEDCWRDYRRGTWSGLAMAIGASMLVHRTDRGDRMFLTMASRHGQHALDLDAAELLRP